MPIIEKGTRVWAPSVIRANLRLGLERYGEGLNSTMERKMDRESMEDRLSVENFTALARLYKHVELREAGQLCSLVTRGCFRGKA